MRKTIARASALIMMVACHDGGDVHGWGATESGDGPRVVWDIETDGLPNIPLPNDMATRPDPTAATGRRLNATTHAATAFERQLRRRLTAIDGFGTFQPLTVAFDRRLDLDNVRRRHRTLPLGDDVLLVINIDPESPGYGAAVPLDLGGGSYPVTLEQSAYFDADPRRQSSNLLFETYDEDQRGDGDGHCDVFEDTNQNGILDAGEDLDGDGHLDVHEDTDHDGVCDLPNLWGTVVDGAGLRRWADLIDFYELQTNTLIARPLVPLDEATRYAAVLTRAAVGEDGTPARSPFTFAHHLAQGKPLAPLFRGGLLDRYGLTGADVAFAWTFTTQSVTSELRALREGLHGVGPLAALSGEYPAAVDRLVPISDSPGRDRYVLHSAGFEDAVRLIFEKVNIGNYDPSRIDALIATYDAVNYVAAGDITTPDLLDAGGGVFDMALDHRMRTGRATHAPQALRFLLVVPKGPGPFPVVLYHHGYTSLKLEALGFAGAFAREGLATLAIDAYGHGIPLGPDLEAVVKSLLAQYESTGLLPFYDAIAKDRARDLNNDGFVEPGGDFWTNDLFHTRDIVRQTVLDHVQLVRALKGFDGARRWSFDDVVGIAGDFDGDGTVDIGGPGIPVYAAGTSMGAILSSVLAAIEPGVEAVAPISGGGGLLEVGARTNLTPIINAVLLPILGPMVLLAPIEDTGVSSLSWLVNDTFEKKVIRFAKVGDAQSLFPSAPARHGDILRVHNLQNGEIREGIVTAGGQARVPVAADLGDEVTVTLLRPDRRTVVKAVTAFEQEVTFQGRAFGIGAPLQSLASGLGYKRGTPELRRLMGIAQVVVEPADPINYVRYYAEPLHVAPEGAVPTRSLFVLTMGDMTVPISTGIAAARAAGLVGYDRIDPRYGMTQNQLLIDHHVVEAIDGLRYFANDCCHGHCDAVNFDIDDLSDGRHPANLPRFAAPGASDGCGEEAPACDVPCQTLPPLRATVERPGGVDGVRFVALDARGSHAVDLPDPASPFDANSFVLKMVARYLASGGREILSP